MKVLIIHREKELFHQFVDYCNASKEPLFHELDVEYAKDTNAARFGNFEGYVQKMEKEGPEWTEPDIEVLEKVQSADAIFTEWGAISSKVIDAGKKLKFIATIRSACENINVSYAKSKGIEVLFCPSRLAEVVADMTIALMLSECRGIVRRNLVSTHGRWTETDKYNDESHAALCNLKIGLVGYGGVARALAKRLIGGFGCEEVLAYDVYTPELIMRADGVIPSSLDRICKESDIISMHLRQNTETMSIMNAERFSMMKKNAIFINTARPGIVDEEALIDALRTGKIRGAGLDVYHQEPLPSDSPLLKMDNVTLMPHSAGITSDIIKNSIKKLISVVRPYLAANG